MTLSSHVRMTESIKEREEEVIQAVLKKDACPFLYCITLPTNQNNLLDIYPYRELRKRKEYETPFVILGLSSSRQEAMEMIAKMAEEVAGKIDRPEEFKEGFHQLIDSLVEEENRPGKG